MPGSQFAPVQTISSRSRGLHPWQFAPWGGELRSRLCKQLAHVRAAGGETVSSPCSGASGASYFFRTYRSFSEGSAFPAPPRLAMKTWHCWRKTQCLCGFANSASGTVQKPRFYAGLSPTVLFPSLKPPSAWALKSRFGAAGFSEAAGKRPALGSVAGPGGFSLCPT